MVRFATYKFNKGEAKHFFTSNTAAAGGVTKGHYVVVTPANQQDYTKEPSLCVKTAAARPEGKCMTCRQFCNVKIGDVSYICPADSAPALAAQLALPSSSALNSIDSDNEGGAR